MEKFYITHNRYPNFSVAYNIDFDLKTVYKNKLPLNCNLTDDDFAVLQKIINAVFVKDETVFKNNFETDADSVYAYILKNGNKSEFEYYGDSAIFALSFINKLESMTNKNAAEKIDG